MPRDAPRQGDLIRIISDTSCVLGLFISVNQCLLAQQRNHNNSSYFSSINQDAHIATKLQQAIPENSNISTCEEVHHLLK
jgi:hypothetical protein